MKSLPEITVNQTQEQVIYRRIRQYLDNVLFTYMDAVLDNNRLENSADDLAGAVKSGRINYSGGVFRGKFSNKLSAELEGLGAKYSRTAGGYRLAESKLPMTVTQALAEVNINNQAKVAKIQKYLQDIADTADYLQNPVDFAPEVKKIGENLDGQFKRSMKTIKVIPADLTDFQLNEIAKNYTTNLNYYIQKWTGEEIVKLREEVGNLALEGYRANALEELIKKRKAVTQRKAKFLARQETKLLVAEYRKNRFKQEGVTRYRWSTVLDGRERKLHRELNGKIFSWDEPPIIDANTGERGNPSEAYNCRCSAIPVIDDAWWKKVNK